MICSRRVIHGPAKTPKVLQTVHGWTIVENSSNQVQTTAETLLVVTPTMDDEHFQHFQTCMRRDTERASATKNVFSAIDHSVEILLQSTTINV